jgi:hypothetical protein
LGQLLLPDPLLSLYHFLSRSPPRPFLFSTTGPAQPTLSACSVSPRPFFSSSRDPPWPWPSNTGDRIKLQKSEPSLCSTRKSYPLSKFFQDLTIWFGLMDKLRSTPRRLRLGFPPINRRPMNFDFVKIHAQTLVLFLVVAAPVAAIVECPDPTLSYRRSFHRCFANSKPRGTF